MHKQQVIAELESLPDVRLPFPAACTDPAFSRCLMEAAGTPELVAEFDRLSGCNLSAVGKGSPLQRAIDSATGRFDGDIRRFAEFVHDAVYSRLPSAAVHVLRLSA
ncbi:TPA: hypothetical protein ACU967_006141 [Burkholderia contaminans]|uniref:hypothetical protein n=1 Tax=Burkholderia TaxID=32008 RepID=UPI0007559E05|nr:MULTISPECIES: hypothetical protein [Burkholderia]KVS28953.1 hypothetical protein WK34_10065 [Burkholderia vietnamiensis]MCA7881031.1 hypothetical protein [Burkholderia contaminans]MCB4348987.1 hypothetical protein [Burkholderia vietnamiensis]MDN8026092.1 hypothetical protein [Burkholderia contaminans]